MIRGPVPKDESIRINRMPPKFDTTTIKADGKLRGSPLPPLPLVNSVQYEWCEATKDWYDTIRRSPQAKIMVETDWAMIQTAALLHNEIWRPKVKSIGAGPLSLLAGQLLRMESAIGNTFESRLKMRVNVVNDQSKEDDERLIEDTAEEIIDYATRLNRKVAERD